MDAKALNDALAGLKACNEDLSVLEEDRLELNEKIRCAVLNEARHDVNLEAGFLAARTTGLHAPQEMPETHKSCVLRRELQVTDDKIKQKVREKMQLDKLVNDIHERMLHLVLDEEIERRCSSNTGVIKAWSLNRVIKNSLPDAGSLYDIFSNSVKNRERIQSGAVHPPDGWYHTYLFALQTVLASEGVSLHGNFKIHHRKRGVYDLNVISLYADGKICVSLPASPSAGPRVLHLVDGYTCMILPVQRGEALREMLSQLRYRGAGIHTGRSVGLVDTNEGMETRVMYDDVHLDVRTRALRYVDTVLESHLWPKHRAYALVGEEGTNNLRTGIHKAIAGHQYIVPSVYLHNLPKYDWNQIRVMRLLLTVDKSEEARRRLSTWSQQCKEKILRAAKDIAIEEEQQLTHAIDLLCQEAFCQCSLRWSDCTCDARVLEEVAKVMI